MGTLKGLLYIAEYIIIATLKNRKLPIDWFKWRVETYYGIPANEFTLRKLLAVAKASDILKYARWVNVNNQLTKTKGGKMEVLSGLVLIVVVIAIGVITIRRMQGR